MSTDVREALTRIFSLDSNPGVVVTRTTPEHLADEVLRELAAQGYAVVAEATRLNVEQAHEVTIRSRDANEDDPMVLRLVPLGATIGVAITKANVVPEDKDYIFIAAAALGSVLPALGFTAGPMVYVNAPRDAV